MGFITEDYIESQAQSQNKVSVNPVISVDRNLTVYKDMKKIAIGIDFSKKTFDAVIMRRVDDDFIELAYGKFDNDEKNFRTFEKWVKRSVKCFPEGRGRSS